MQATFSISQAVAGNIVYDINHDRRDFESLQQLIDIVHEHKITKIRLSAPPGMFIPILELVDVILANEMYVDSTIKLGFGHKLCMFGANIKYFGIVHPKSCFMFTTDPRVRRLAVWHTSQLQMLVGRELDLLYTEIHSDYSLEGINTSHFISKCGRPDIRPLVMCSRLRKLVIDRFSHPVEQVECFELKYYKCPIAIPAIDRMIDNRRLKKVKPVSC